MDNFQRCILPSIEICVRPCKPAYYYRQEYLLPKRFAQSPSQKSLSPYNFIVPDNIDEAARRHDQAPIHSHLHHAEQLL